MEKLEYLKEINKHSCDLEETKVRLRLQIRDDQDEEKLMQVFQKEKERLACERDDLVQYLKAISDDIETMDQIIVQTKSERSKNIESTKKLINDFRQGTTRINKLRAQLSLPALDNNEFIENLDIIDSKSGLANEWPTQQALREQMLNNSALSMLNKTVSKPLTSSKSSNLNFGHHHSDQNLPSLAERRTERSLGSNFLQQPPPMKTCMSCNQQIHRNAPICPYCKAKSRSRNPKKPKRKVEE